MDRLIMITNDDGIDSDGIIRLAKCAKEFGEVYVVAPKNQCSAMSHSITLRHPFRVYPAEFPVEGVKAFAVDGTPGDCVRVGILNILPKKPDVVFSGINLGYNCATDIPYSATAGAAFEAIFQGSRAIAFSEGIDEAHETTKAYLREIMAELIDRPLPYGQIWNVNFPGCAIGDCRGILRDRTVAHKGLFRDRYDEKKQPDGSVEFMVNGIMDSEAEEGTDLRALLDNYVSIGVVQNIG